MLELIEVSDKVAWLSEPGSYETKLRELERQFESKAAELRDEYLAIVLQIRRDTGAVRAARQAQSGWTMKPR